MHESSLGFWSIFMGVIGCLSFATPAEADDKLVPLSRHDVSEGRFCTAINVVNSSAETARVLPAYKSYPLTVEFWCKLYSHDQFNILVANEPKESADHWEIYTEAGTGTLSAYIPGINPSIIKSNVAIADKQWHYVAMVVDDAQVALYADGCEVVKTRIEKNAKGIIKPGKLSVGATASFCCDGVIDDLRISKVARRIQGVPDTPFKADSQTIGLWNFDFIEGAKRFADASSNANLISKIERLSLSELDRRSYEAGPAPLDSKAECISLQKGKIEIPAKSSAMLLNGRWQLLEGGEADTRLSGDWTDAIPATVPGSIHTALHQAGVIPFPYFGSNQEIARQWSAKTYWYRKTFARPPKGQDQTLVFHGVCNRCTIWLNGKQLGKHEGMFTRIEFPVEGLLQDENTLIVKLDPALPWTETVVFNNSYGWHYSKFPPLGIWQSVELRGEPAVAVQNPFVATRDAQAGTVDLVVNLSGPRGGWSGKLTGTITPDNFTGSSRQFETTVQSAEPNKKLHLQFNVPNPQLWWPVDLGKPNLYRLKLAFTSSDGKSPDVKELTFGIRTIHMAPVNGRPAPGCFDWTFIVNGRPIFVKGTGWCTCDAMLDFSRERYDRQLTLAASQHNQMIRAWGSGMVETDDFYDLCDRKGIMVMQEWPTAWNSHKTQPYSMLEQAVCENILRLRSRASLAIYTGGNESNEPFGPAIDMMGRLAIELDGTRDFHRGEPWGGSLHNYDVYWGGAPLDRSLNIQSIFFGEFGIASYPNCESVLRFLPDDEKKLWPPSAHKTFAYHTPIFNTSQDLERLTRMAQYFTAGHTMERYIVGTQLAQSIGVRHALELARSRWPNATGALYYKLNDNCPAASWSTVDWYGAPKISHYLIQKSYAPLLAIALFTKTDTQGEQLTLPVFLLDDADALKEADWEVRVRAFGADLMQIAEKSFQGRGSIRQVSPLGDFAVTANQTKSSPLMVVTDVLRSGVLIARNDYAINYSAVKDCLFQLPRTKLEYHLTGQKLSIANRGSVPAVGVHVLRKGHLDTFFADRNYLWLEPGETTTIEVNETTDLSVEAWNAN